MKYLFLLTFISFHTLAEGPAISGKLLKNESCSKKAMIWLSLDKENYKERLLLMHTEVPQGGTFRFYVKPGEYQVRASDEVGCEFLKKVEIKEGEIELSIVMVKK